MAPFRTAAELLPPNILQKLSPNARRVYATVWHRLDGYSSPTVWMLDAEIIKRAYIRPEQLASAQSELSRAGLLGMLPGVVQTRYRILDPDEPDEIGQMVSEPPSESGS
jgi:hypothetical protein